MSSVIRGSDNFDSAGGAALKAWVNFNGIGTVAIRAAFNVSSITDNGTGDFNINFTNAMADANYAVVGVVAPADTNRNNFAVGPFLNGNPTTPPEGNTKFNNTFRMTTGIAGSATMVDYPSNYVAVYR